MEFIDDCCRNWSVGRFIVHTDKHGVTNSLFLESILTNMGAHWGAIVSLKRLEDRFVYWLVEGRSSLFSYFTFCTADNFWKSRNIGINCRQWQESKKFDLLLGCNIRWVKIFFCVNQEQLWWKVFTIWPRLLSSKAGYLCEYCLRVPSIKEKLYKANLISDRHNQGHRFCRDRNPVSLNLLCSGGLVNNIEVGYNWELR